MTGAGMSGHQMLTQTHGWTRDGQRSVAGAVCQYYLQVVPKKLTDVLDCLEDIFAELWTEMQTGSLGMCSDWDHLTNLPQ